MQTSRLPPRQGALRDILILGAATAFFLGALSLLLVFHQNDGTSRFLPLGKLTSSGIIRRLPMSRESWIAIREGAIVFSGDIVQTDISTSATILLSNGSVVTLAEDSTAQFELNSDQLDVTLFDGNVKVPEGVSLRKGTAIHYTPPPEIQRGILAFPEIIPVPLIYGPTR